MNPNISLYLLGSVLLSFGGTGCENDPPSVISNGDSAENADTDTRSDDGIPSDIDTGFLNVDLPIDTADPCLGVNQLTTPLRSNEFSFMVEFQFSDSDLLVTSTDTVTADPGRYRQISVEADGELILKPGTYFAESIHIEPGATVRTEDTVAPVIVHVRSAMTIEGSWNTRNASSIVLVTLSDTGPVTITGDFHGTLVAPGADVLLSGSLPDSYGGAFLVGSLAAEPGTVVEWRTFQFWDYIVPPVLTVDCISRAARLHSAALFSYESASFFRMEIPRGERNDISRMDEERQGPLVVYNSGYHDKYYWLPFIGEEICWTLAGQTVCANDETRGCTLDDYTYVNIYCPICTPENPDFAEDTDYRIEDLPGIEQGQVVVADTDALSDTDSTLPVDTDLTYSILTYTFTFYRTPLDGVVCTEVPSDLPSDMSIETP